jgi:hypothetical protein
LLSDIVVLKEDKKSNKIKSTTKCKKCLNEKLHVTLWCSISANSRNTEHINSMMMIQLCAIISRHFIFVFPSLEFSKVAGKVWRSKKNMRYKYTRDYAGLLSEAHKSFIVLFVPFHTVFYISFIFIRDDLDIDFTSRVINR